VSSFGDVLYFSGSSLSSSNSLHNHLSASSLGLANQLSNLPSLLTANAQSQLLALGQQVSQST